MAAREPASLGDGAKGSTIGASHVLAWEPTSWGGRAKGATMGAEPLGKMGFHHSGRWDPRARMQVLT
jgi:hypothetical protein